MYDRFESTAMGKYELEKTSTFRNVLIGIAVAVAAFVVVDYLFSGAAVFLGFIAAAIAIYFFARR